MIWSYGVTTIQQRRDTLLPKTLASLRAGGFEQPWLFVDGITHSEAMHWEERFACPVTVRRPPPIRTYGNWCLALGELYLRTPKADRYAMFQDDFVTYTNLRQYLEACVLNEKTYWNLYTFPINHQGIAGVSGWHPSPTQQGFGAVALVFSRAGVIDLLANKYMAERPLDVHRGHKSLDGGIIEALKPLGYKEYVHNPSLVQHTGMMSSIDKRRNTLKDCANFPTYKWNEATLAPSFRGESFDAMSLLHATPA